LILGALYLSGPGQVLKDPGLNPIYTL
jgi:hypothetical protein